VVEFVALNVNNVNSSHTALRGARKPTGVFIRIIVTEKVLNHSQKYLLEEKTIILYIIYILYILYL